jgi:dipeptidyl-peptidase-4
MADSARLALHILSRVQDRLYLVIADSSGGKPKTLFTETAKAWINLRDDFEFLEDGRLVWGSEADGWRHLYLRNADGSVVKRLTEGAWEVTDLDCVNPKTGHIYFRSTEAGPTERQFYAVGLEGGAPVRLTKEAGTHAISMARGCANYVDAHSSITEPERRSLHSSLGDRIAVLTGRNTKLLEEYDLVTPELTTFRGSDGILFHARLTRPVGFDPSKKYPAIVMVYGGPHSQTVRNSWRGADWDQALAHRGYVVWQMDNRGAAGRGHLWEAPLYRRFGARELADQLEGVRHIASLGFVDSARIGIYGWSYGGFMTLYSMLTSPETFRAGIAGAPVTDWRNYDTIYTERYLGLPSQNEDGYKLSSPIHKAEQLKGALMLAHNFEDDNVLFQHTLRMMDALQKAGKQFDLLLYPQKTHGVTGSPLRSHMLEAMTSFFDRHLKSKQGL